VYKGCIVLFIKIHLAFKEQRVLLSPKERVSSEIIGIKSGMDR
jgi:hypothetical protein